MGFLLLERPSERHILVLKLLEKYFNKNFTIDEIHYLLEVIIHNTINLDEGLFSTIFLDIIKDFNQNYLGKYNNLPPEEIDIDPSNYVLRKEFHEGLKIFYKDLSESIEK